MFVVGRIWHSGAGGVVIMRNSVAQTWCSRFDYLAERLCLANIHWRLLYCETGESHQRPWHAPLRTGSAGSTPSHHLIELVSLSRVHHRAGTQSRQAAVLHSALR